VFTLFFNKKTQNFPAKVKRHAWARRIIGIKIFFRGKFMPDFASWQLAVFVYFKAVLYYDDI